MIKNRIRDLALVILFFSSFFGRTQIPPSDPSYTLFLSDDFNSFDSNVWDKYSEYNHYGGIQCYTSRANNVFIDANGAGSGNGALVLRLAKENYTCNTAGGGCTQYSLACNCFVSMPTPTFAYTSGGVELKPTYGDPTLFRYGYIETRVKLPYIANSKLWPAIWTSLGYNVPTPWYSVGEFEVFEQLQITSPVGNESYQDDFRLGTGMFYFYSPLELSYQQAILPTSYANSWHTFAVDWSPERFIWYYDGVPVMNLKNRPYGSGYEITGGTYMGGGVHELVRLIMNLAYQGDGSISFPQDMYIDYVKIYRPTNDCNTDVISTSYNFSGYDSKIKNKIEIGGTGGSTTWPSNPTLSLKAKQHILLDEGFSTPTSGSVDIFIDVPGCN